MRELTDHEVDLIRNDLLEEGVEMPELLDDILDHLCTGIELEMENGSAFQQAYLEMRNVVIPHGALEIQQATTYLLTNNLKTMMRKVLFISGFFWASTTLIAVLLNVLHWPMGGMLTQVSGILLGAAFIPSAIMYLMRFQTQRGFKEWGLYISGALVSLVTIFACWFKLMHWPGANVLMVLSLTSLALIFLPFLVWVLYDREKKFEMEG